MDYVRGLQVSGFHRAIADAKYNKGHHFTIQQNNADIVEVALSSASGSLQNVVSRMHAVTHGSPRFVFYLTAEITEVIYYAE